VNPAKYPFRVERVGNKGSDYGQHKTREGAEKRISLFVAAGRGKITKDAFVIVDDREVQA
jgi:hypothetical protein